MIYIVDAYNVIHKIPQLERLLDKDLRAGRDALITLCAGYASARGDILNIILVFDGKSQFNDLPELSRPKLKVVFSETDEDADERIATILEKMAKERHKTVVSDDNFVRNHARAYEASVMSVSEFEKLILPKNQKRHPGRQEDVLPSKIADEITKAYRKELGLD